MLSESRLLQFVKGDPQHRWFFLYAFMKWSLAGGSQPGNEVQVGRQPK